MMEDTRAHLLPLTWQSSKVVLLHGCEDDDRKMKIGRLAFRDTGEARSHRSALQICLPSHQPAVSLIRAASLRYENREGH